MSVATFEERLLPVLVDELVRRPTAVESHPARWRRPSRRLALAAFVAAALVATLAVVTGGTSQTVIKVSVASPAMEPTLKEGGVVAVDTSAYSSTLPVRGDIVAFRNPRSPDNVFLSRVIGVPGDRIVESHGVVSVNGRILAEPYARLDGRSGSWIVESGHVFVMGDNRPIALDSRWKGAGAIGQVRIGELLGRVIGVASNGHPDVPPGPASTEAGPS